MRAGFPTLGAAIVVAAVATIFVLKPFEAAFHHWAFAVAVAIVGLALLAQAIAALRPASAQERFAALGGFGGALLCAAMMSAAFAVGPPHALAGSPGQITPVKDGARVAVIFPPFTAQAATSNPPDTVLVVDRGGAPHELHDGDTYKSGQYVLRAGTGPIALVSASTPAGKPVTITQPQGTTFLSRYLVFPVVRGDQRYDYFAVPPLHRTVNVAYYPSYRDDARHIYIASPFVLVQIAEENGKELFRGATISGRPVRAAGVVLTFTLGSYPLIALSSAPAALAYWLGLLMIAAGLIGYCVVELRPARTERATRAAK